MPLSASQALVVGALVGVLVIAISCVSACLWCVRRARFWQTRAAKAAITATNCQERVSGMMRDEARDMMRRANPHLH